MGKKKKKENINKAETQENIKNNTILAVPENITKESVNDEKNIEEEENINNTIETSDSNKSENISNENDTIVDKTPEPETENNANISNEISENNSDNNISSQSEEIIHETDKQNENNNESQPKKKSHIKIIIILCIIIGLLLLTLLFSTIFAIFNNGNENILNGTYIENIDVSNLSKEQALNTLNNEYQNKMSNIIILKHKDYESQISLAQLELTYNFNDAINEAYSKGRSGNIFKDNFDIIGSLFSNTTIRPRFSYNEELINSLIKEIEMNISDRLVEPSYYIEENNLVISKGKDGNIIDSNALKNNISNIIDNIDNANYTIELPVIFKKVDSIDLNKIYNEIHKTPVNAYFTKDPYVIYPHVDGIDFAITMEEAKNIVNNSTEEEIVIPLTVTSPTITTSDLGDEAFPDELSSFDTTYSTNNVSRSTNIRLASNKINGIVVMPGEIFSYNATVGQRTSAAGFQPAAVYSGGEVTTGLGGGICQVSSTLYNAVLLANLEIVERQNHGFNPGYVPVSRDATVSWGAPDFKFQNTRKYPIRIVCDGDGGTISVQILGLKESVEYDVDIESYVTSWISYSTITRNDPNLEPGETRVIQSGSNGCRSVAYRILYLNGEEVSRELLSQDTYSPHNRIVAVGN